MKLREILATNLNQLPKIAANWILCEKSNKDLTATKTYIHQIYGKKSGIFTKPAFSESMQDILMTPCANQARNKSDRYSRLT